MKTLLLASALLFFWADSARSDFLDPETNHRKHGAKGGQVTCGATLTGNKLFILSADLDCSAAMGPITIKDRAQLDLNGHTLESDVVLDGRRAALIDGRVDCGRVQRPYFVEVCVIIQGEGEHLLKNVLMQAEASEGIIVIRSTNNWLIGNTANSTNGGGFVVTTNNLVAMAKSVQLARHRSRHRFAVHGSNNILRGNIALFAGEVQFEINGNGNLLVNNTGIGESHFIDFDISGDFNVVKQNTSSGAGDANYRIRGNGNHISRNVAFTSRTIGSGGFVVSGQNNVITDNLAPGIIATDTNPLCDSNIWTGNLFGSTNQPCIE
jgi:hypothetical protein